MKQPTCFVICPIGDEGSEVRNDADLLHDFIIKPVLAETPFSMEVKRADKLGQPGIITNQIIHEIETADLVVADLSQGNPNVFYEVAIRHVTRRPFIHLIRRGDRIPFDNAPVRAIEFDVRDLRSVDAAKNELALQAKTAIEKGLSESPVSIAVTMDSLRQSGNSEKIAMADILAEVASLRGAVDRMNASNAPKAFRPNAAGIFGNSGKLPDLLGGSPNGQGSILGELMKSYALDSSTASTAAQKSLGEAIRELEESSKKRAGD